MSAPWQPLRPPKTHKGKKNPDMFKGPDTEVTPGNKVRFQEDTVKLTIYSDDINTLVNDRGFTDNQILGQP